MDNGSVDQINVLELTHYFVFFYKFKNEKNSNVLIISKGVLKFLSI